jgi:diphthine synthase
VRADLQDPVGEGEGLGRGLILISIGLFDEKDLSLRALEEARRCDSIYAELYTTRLATGLERLEALVGRRIRGLRRGDLEEGAEALLEEAERLRVGVMVGGDCLAATTHISLLIMAAKRGIPFRVVHGSSILTAVAETGLSLYKFGRTVTLPLPGRGAPDTVLRAIYENRMLGLHTLVLLDLEVEEDRYLTVKEALQILLASDRLGVLDEGSLVVGVARLGSDAPLIRAGRAGEVMRESFGEPPHVLIIPGSLHFVEAEALKVLGGCPAEALGAVERSDDLAPLISRYLEGCHRVLEELRLAPLPARVGEERVRELISHAERYLRDAEYYADNLRISSIAAASYCEGILDAARLLGLMEFDWPKMPRRG